MAAVIDTGAEKSCVSSEIFQKYIWFKQLHRVNYKVLSATKAVCNIRGSVQLNIAIEKEKVEWQFLIIDDLQFDFILGVDFLSHTDAQIRLQKDCLNFTMLNEIEVEILWNAKHDNTERQELRKGELLSVENRMLSTA